MVYCGISLYVKAASRDGSQSKFKKMIDTSETSEIANGENALKTFVKEMFFKAGFSPDEVAVRRGSGAWEVDIKVLDAGLVIGEDGVHLPAWEQILRAAAQKLAPEAPRISFDVNHYRAMKNEDLREIARRAAREAVLKKKPVELEAMNAYERRIVHAELALRPDVITESVGEDPNRKVVVKALETNSSG
jgi:spoIIIJ-associated protein